MKKRYALVAALLLMAAVLAPVTAKAASQTKTKSKTIKAGQVFYVLNTNIKKNKVTSNKYVITPRNSSSYYDLIFVRGTADSPSVRALVNTNFKYSSDVVSGYLKKSAKANSGCLLAIRVRSGSVKVQVSSTRNASSFALKFRQAADSKTILRMADVEKGKRIQFTMPAGNIDDMPLIFGGTIGTKIKRTLSDTRYELYTFGEKKLVRTTYQNKKAVSSASVSYNSTYTDAAGRKFYFSIIPVPASATLRISGWMATTKGYARYFYPKEYLGLKVTLEES